jgi:hypothetical protein
VTLVEDGGADLPARLALADAGTKKLGHAGVHAVDGLAGAAQGVDLLDRLAHAQLADDRRRQALLGVGQRGAHPEHLLGPHPVGQRDAASPGQAGSDDGVGIIRLAPADDLDIQVSHRRSQHGRHLEPGGHHERLPHSRHD